MGIYNSMETRSSGVYSHHNLTSGLDQVPGQGKKGHLIGGMCPGPPLVLLWWWASPFLCEMVFPLSMGISGHRVLS